MEQFDFTDWTDEKLEERAHHLGEHILIAAEGTTRHDQMEREMNHLVFELSTRAIAETIASAVQ